MLLPNVVETTSLFDICLCQLIFWKTFNWVQIAIISTIFSQIISLTNTCEEIHSNISSKFTAFVRYTNENRHTFCDAWFPIFVPLITVVSSQYQMTWHKILWKKTNIWQFVLLFSNWSNRLFSNAMAVVLFRLEICRWFHILTFQSRIMLAISRWTKSTTQICSSGFSRLKLTQPMHRSYYGCKVIVLKYFIFNRKIIYG